MKKICDWCVKQLKKFARYIHDDRYLFFTLLIVALQMLLHQIFALLAGVNGSVVNPFIQGVWFYLAAFGVAIFGGKYFGKIFLLLFVVLHGFVIITTYFMLYQFHLELTSDAFFVLSASSPDEAREFLASFLNLPVILIILSGVAITTLCVWWVCRTKFARSFQAMAVATVLVLPFLINVARFSARGDYNDIIETPGIPTLISSYVESRRIFNQFIEMERHPELPKQVHRETPRQPIVGVLVIGESATRSHLGVYGYPRPTTPRLASVKPKPVMFDHVISAAGNTVLSLKFMLTTANLLSQYDLRYTLYDALRAAGYRSTLISKQSAWGKFDGPIGIFTAHNDHRLYIHKTQPHALDDACLAPLKQTLATENSPLFVTIHLAGSHRQFESRYPKDFSVFDTQNDEISKQTPAHARKEIDYYDNSILFTDYLLGEMIDELKKLKQPVFLLYVSDHGESIATNVKRSSAALDKKIYEVPCVFWANDAYREAFPNILQAAEQNRHKAIQTDSLMYSILTAADISFQDFPSQFSLFTKDYRPPEKLFLGITGKLYNENK